MTQLVSLKKLNKRYEHQSVLTSLDFELVKGQVHGLLGRNGAGKSTMMRILLGLAEADSGNCQLFGQDLSKLTDEHKQRLGYVPQEFVGFDSFRIGKLIDFVAGHYQQWDMAFCLDLLKKFELNAKQKVKDISGGQKQLLSIILAMSHRPELLILDEPVAALDPVNRREFLALVLDEAVENGSSVLFSTHITSDLERVASHVSFLVDGKIQLQGELEDLKDSLYRVPKALQLDSQASLFSTANEEVFCLRESVPEQARSMNLEDLFLMVSGREA